jgi:hypothetical protein
MDSGVLVPDDGDILEWAEDIKSRKYVLFV